MVVEEWTSFESIAQRAHAMPVVDAEQVVEFREPHRLSLLFTRELGLATLHEDASPPVRGGVEEETKALASSSDELRPRNEPQRRIERGPVTCREPSLVVLE